jgi:hypothetical protein
VRPVITVTAAGDGTECPPGYAEPAADYITISAVTFRAHRLWTRLWTGLGQREENLLRAGGNYRMNGGRPQPVHSRRAAGRAAGTAPVDAGSGSELGRQQISPGSTDPMTTTSLYLSPELSNQQASGGGWSSERRLNLQTEGRFQ